MADTKLTKAVAAANGMIALAQQTLNLRAQIDAFVKAYNSEGYSTTWNAFATAAQNADGSLGAADASPVSGHPIDTRLTGLTALGKSVPATQLVSGVTMLMQLQNFFGGLAVTTGNYSQTVDDLAN